MKKDRALRRFSCSIAALSVLLSPAMAAAQDSPAALLPSSRWEASADVDSCSIARGFADEAALLTIRTVPTSGRLELMVASKGWANRKDGRATATLVAGNDGARFDSIAWLDRLPEGQIGVARIAGVDERFVRRMTDGSDLIIQIGNGDIIVFKLADLAPALRALHKCNDMLMRNLGVDPMPLYRLRTGPIPVGQRENWIDGEDYPDWASAQGRQGKAVIRFVVQTNGRIRDCETVVSTGDAGLDNYSCRLMLKRARYQPAIGEDGKLAEAPQIDAVNWVLAPVLGGAQPINERGSSVVQLSGVMKQPPRRVAYLTR